MPATSDIREKSNLQVRSAAKRKTSLNVQNILQTIYFGDKYLLDLMWFLNVTSQGLGTIQ